MKKKFYILISFLIIFITCFNIFSKEDIAKQVNDSDDQQNFAVSSEQIQILVQTFEKMKNTYKIEKEMPRYVVLTEEEFSEKVSTEYLNKIACYDIASQNIYIRDNFSIQDQAFIALEICKYVSAQKDSLGGFSYKVEGYENLTSGYAINNGLAKYFASKLYDFPENKEIYNLEEHIAELFTIVWGDEELRKMYFSSDVDKIRADYNKTFNKICPTEENSFDILNGYLDWYSDLSKVELNKDKYSQEFIEIIHSIVKNILIYGEEKGVDVQMKESIKKLITTESFIRWDQTSVKEIIE